MEVASLLWLGMLRGVVGSWELFVFVEEEGGMGETGV